MPDSISVSSIMRRTDLIILSFTIYAFAAVTAASAQGDLAQSRFQIMDLGFTEIVDTSKGIEILAEGHEWTEGPLWVDNLQMLLYADIPRNSIYKWTEEGGSEVYLKPSGYLGEGFSGREPGSNGMLLNSNGQLVLCQHGERQLALMNAELTDPDPDFTSLASMFKGLRLNSPNDLALHSDGSLYFTDPPYGLPQQMQDEEKEIDFQGVYRLSSDGNVDLLTSELTRPNGIAFSPDLKTLYVANSDPDRAYWKSFEVKEDGFLGRGSFFFDVTDRVPGSKGLPDGLKVHSSGIIFATGPGGIYVFTPGAKLLGLIETGQATSNCALNANETALYITADMFVMRIYLKHSN